MEDWQKLNNILIEEMKLKGTLKTRKMEQVLREVPRHWFVSKEQQKYAYADIPLQTLEGQTISQPSTVVMMTEALNVTKGLKVLEIGTGSGWQAAILGKLVGEEEIGRAH